MNILLKPLLTEKASAVNDKGKFTFIVHKKANKVEIKKAVEKTYKVSVKNINTINLINNITFFFTFINR